MMQNAPDLKAAREVADFLGTVHHEFHYTIQVRLIISLLVLTIWSNFGFGFGHFISTWSEFKYR